MRRIHRAFAAAAALSACPLLRTQPAHADLLKLQRWATNQGSWVTPNSWDAGDFDGNGKTDMVFVFKNCSNCPLPGFPTVGADFIAADLHLSCDNNAVPCPPGTGSAGNPSGAFTKLRAFLADDENGTALFVDQDSLDECNGLTDCDEVSGKKSKFYAGDFNGDGKTDLVWTYASLGRLVFKVGLSDGVSGVFHFCTWGNGDQGGFVDPSDWVVGDFNGDGLDDIAYLFSDHGQIDMDVHLSKGSCNGGEGFTLQRWATDQGSWVQPAKFLAADYDGDGRTDIAFAFNDNNKISLDVHRSTGHSFVLERWATGQGSWITTSQWATVRGRLNSPDKVPGISLITPFLTPAPGDGLGGAGLGDIIYAFNDAGGISIDGHLANTSVFTANTTAGVFTLDRYATKQGSYPTSVLFRGGDFNGDTIGDVVDAFNTGGQISIDVHLGTCLGPLDYSGACCQAFASVCNGQCCNGTCSDSLSATNGCCPFGQTCPPPPPPR